MVGTLTLRRSRKYGEKHVGSKSLRSLSSWLQVAGARLARWICVATLAGSGLYGGVLHPRSNPLHVSIQKQITVSLKAEQL